MGYDDELAVLREHIKGIDKKILALFEDRMDIVKKIAALKGYYGKKVSDSRREEEVIAQALCLLRNKEYSEEAKSFFRALIETSKKSEEKLIGKREAPAGAAAGRVGYLGIRGSFSHIAAEEAFGGADFVSYDTFEDIFEGLKNGEIDRAIVPAENTETGSITAVIDLLAKYGFYITAEKMLRVAHSLLGTADSEIGDIKAIYSHPEPFAQCSAFFLGYPHVEKRSSLSTAQAARTVAQQGDKTLACIASSKAAEVYGLKVLRENIQNSGSNYTRFVVVEKQPRSAVGCDKTSVVLMTQHKPGALSAVLNTFAEGKINILKLESRPVRGKPFEYMFHIDFEGSIYDEGVKKTIDKVREKSQEFIFLGSYGKDSIQ